MRKAKADTVAGDAPVLVIWSVKLRKIAPSFTLRSGGRVGAQRHGCGRALGDRPGRIQEPLDIYRAGLAAFQSAGHVEEAIAVKDGRGEISGGRYRAGRLNGRIGARSTDARGPERVRLPEGDRLALLRQEATAQPS